MNVLHSFILDERGHTRREARGPEGKRPTIIDYCVSNFNETTFELPSSSSVTP
jgi:hypothetical protein